MDTILVVNAGSSSVKFQVFALSGGDDLSCLIKGQMDGIGVRPKLRAEGDDKALLVEQTFEPAQVGDVGAGIRAAGAWLRGSRKLDPIAVGHRVVHGGPKYHEPVLIDDPTLADLERYAPLAPLHQPNNLAAIRAIRAQAPELPQVACFDTAFHRAHDALADHYAIPLAYYDEGVRRYGFHGLSYEYVAARLRQVAPDIAARRTLKPFSSRRAMILPALLAPNASGLTIVSV